MELWCKQLEPRTTKNYLRCSTNPRLTSAWFGIIALETDKQARTHTFKTIPNQRLLWCKYGFLPNQQPTWKQCRMTVKHKQDIPAKSLDLWVSRTNSHLNAVAFTARRACSAHTIALGRAVCEHASMHWNAWRTTYVLCKALTRMRNVVDTHKIFELPLYITPAVASLLLHERKMLGVLELHRDIGECNLNLPGKATSHF